jgi:glycogen debranching enzyme
MSKQGQTAYTVEGQEVSAAGVPWFVTLFGHDSLITALQTLAYNPGITEETLRLLASYRGQHLDEWRDAQSGKILHELRVGKMARWGGNPHTPYYGTIDATPPIALVEVQGYVYLAGHSVAT